MARVQIPSVPIYFMAPKWGRELAGGGGGTSVHVIMGPGAIASSNYGSKPQRNAPRCITALRRDHPKVKWIAGHLLNDNMGGPGVSENLTPLTATTNKRHSAVELKVKELLIISNQFFNIDKSEVEKAISRAVTEKDKRAELAKLYVHAIEMKVIVSNTKMTMPVLDKKTGRTKDVDVKAPHAIQVRAKAIRYDCTEAGNWVRSKSSPDITKAVNRVIRNE
ncbi:hypothetical protein ABNQ38_03155 [Azospirillum sp. A29]|uniref:hypothetical protein n=1 Tax=Azospirillum sp. A29 TaxID=3160606 RepID=UPI00366E792B